MVSIDELVKIESILHRGGNPRVCNEYMGKIRRWLATGEGSDDVRGRLQQLVARFGAVRFATSPRRPQ